MPTALRHWLLNHPVISQVTLALLALLLGVLVYYFDRAPGTAYFLPVHAPAAGGENLVFGPLGLLLPEFVHVYAFILLTSAAIVPGARGLMAISLGWLVIELLFEIGQHPALAPVLAASVPAWFQQLPVLDNTVSYFERGRFDPLDMLAITLGALAGYLTAACFVARAPVADTHV